VSRLTLVVHFILEHNSRWTIPTIKSPYVLIRHPILKKPKTVAYLLKADSWCTYLKCGAKKVSIKNLVLLTFVKNKKRHT
jgi:hypothetical protein